MRRREFILFLGAMAAALSPLPLRAQRATKLPRLGVLLYSTPQGDPKVAHSRLRSYLSVGAGWSGPVYRRIQRPHCLSVT